MPFENGSSDIIFGRESLGTECYIDKDVAERHMNHWERRIDEGEVQVKVHWLIETGQGCDNREEYTWCTVRMIEGDEPNITFAPKSRDPNIRTMASGSGANRGVGAESQGGWSAPIHILLHEMKVN